jgi:tellurite resistance protein TerC
MVALPHVFFTEFLTKPVWMWGIFFTIVVLLLIFDLGILHKDQHEINIKESLLLSGFYVSMGLCFGGWIWYEMGSPSALEYLTGFIVEKTLSMDNIFIIAMIFSFFSIPRKYQHRVLFWGILGVIFLRAIMIGLGATLVSQYEWVLYIFALFLVLTGMKLLILTQGMQYLIAKSKKTRPIIITLWLIGCLFMGYAVKKGLEHAGTGQTIEYILYIILALTAYLGIRVALITHQEESDLADNPFLIWLRKHVRITDKLHGQAFFVKQEHPKTHKKVLYITPLFLALGTIEVADVIFAVDSVPAIFVITTDPYLVYTSNIFAILGLRALYFALSAMLARFYYLKYALSVVLLFIGAKIFIANLMGWEKFPSNWSLLITVSILGCGFGYSIWKTRDLTTK